MIEWIPQHCETLKRTFLRRIFKSIIFIDLQKAKVKIDAKRQ